MTEYETLHSRWRYADGHLYSKRTGKIVGTPFSGGYMQTSTTVDGVRYCIRIHRAIFLMHHGHLPEVVDHINGDILDNRIENLRAATLAQNSFNRAVGQRNKLGIKGVVYEKRLGQRPYVAYIKINGKQNRIGNYATVEEAHAAYCSLAQQHFGEYNHT